MRTQTPHSTIFHFSKFFYTKCDIFESEVIQDIFIYIYMVLLSCLCIFFKHKIPKSVEELNK